MQRDSLCWRFGIWCYLPLCGPAVLWVWCSYLQWPYLQCGSPALGWTVNLFHQILVFLQFCKNIWMVLVIDPSHYESTVHITVPVRLQHLQLLTGSHFEISGWYLQQYSGSDLVEPVAQPPSCSSHGWQHGQQQSLWFHQLCSWLLFLFPVLSSPSYFNSSFSSSSYFLTSSSSSSSHPSYSLSNIGLHCCPNQMFTCGLFIVLKLWFVSELII